MTEHNHFVEVPVNCLTITGLLEIQHGLHVYIKHTMHSFERGDLDATATKARLAHVADVNKSLLETYINHHEENRLKEPF